MAVVNERREARLFVRLTCGSAEHPEPISLSIPVNDPTTVRNLELFIHEHTHSETGVKGMDLDRSALYTVLEKFFTQELPRIAEIMARRKWTFGFEVKIQQAISSGHSELSEG